MRLYDQMKKTERRHLRAALLNWYPFRGGERALLLGADAGALLPLLERHYARVDVIPPESTESELAEKARAIPPDGRYDCIAAADLAEGCGDVPRLLRQLYGLLAEDGVLLLAYRNRFGLKYLCGGVDEYSPAPFASLQPPEGGPRLYARREMESLLRGAGFAQPRCYFLMPDAEFVQAVYTEDALPDDSIRDRVFPFDLHDSPLIAWEGDLYDDLVREELLPHMANVCLAECRKPGTAAPDKEVVYAALSTDRGPEHGFATVLYSDGNAAKLPLWAEGMDALKSLCDNMEALKSRGLLTVEHRLTDRGIQMPRIREEGLLPYLRRQLPDHPEAFLAVFEQLYRDVLQSSETVSAPPDGLREIWGAEAEELEPLLEKAWIDMIPYNAFRAGERIRYYDQEFCVENCPAKYVLFRALFYTWLHIPEAEDTLPLETVKEHFGLAALWDGFRLREERFVTQNRNWEALEDIYSHVAPDRAAIAARRRALDPLADLRDVHRVQLELLKELDRVCREHGLRYMAIHGTLLGAVRHHGFIPWDDDVDVAMPREDYDRLVKLGSRALEEGFFLQTPRNNYGCFYGGYCKLRRNDTAAIEPQNKGKDGAVCHQGIWIDILPLDVCPEDAETRKRLQRRLSVMQRVVYAKAYAPEQFVPKDVPKAQIGLYYLMSKCVRRRTLLRRIDRLCREQSGSPLRGILACYYGKRENKNVWPAEAVESVTEMPFEDMMLPVPAGWELILRRRYGADFMMLPPVEKRYRHSGVIFYSGEKK